MHAKGITNYRNEPDESRNGDACERNYQLRIKANDELGECERGAPLVMNLMKAGMMMRTLGVAFLVHGPDESRNDDAKPQGQE